MPSFFFNLKILLQSHSAKYKIQYRSESHIAERACKFKLRQINKISKAHLQLEIQKLQMSLVAHRLIIGESKL
jgi:hypothetical protein